MLFSINAGLDKIATNGIIEATPRESISATNRSKNVSIIVTFLSLFESKLIIFKNLLIYFFFASDKNLYARKYTIKKINTDTNIYFGF